MGRARVDRDGFDKAFDRLWPMARTAAYRVLGDVGAAEEVASEALSRAFARWGKLVGTEHLDAWVLRVAINVAIDRTRRRRTPVLVTEPASPEDLSVLRLALTEALRALPARQREAVALRYLTDLREQDVATTLGISASAVKTHVHRGLAALRERLGEAPVEEVLHRV